MKDPASQELNAPLDTLLLGEVQLLLAEKRTTLSTLRIGIAIFAFPLSVLSVLIATSKSYDIREVWHWLVPLLLMNVGLVALGVYLIIHGLRRLHHYNQLIEAYKRQHTRLNELLG